MQMLQHASPARGLPRRAFLKSLGAAGGLAIGGSASFARAAAARFAAGQGQVDITPPLGVEMGGFHRAPGKERRIEGIRQAPAARALLLTLGSEQAAIVSIDVLGISVALGQRVQRQIERALGIPAANVRLCSTHSHSMPTFRYCRQWGAIPEVFMAEVEGKIVQAVRLARADLASAEIYLGKSVAQGANYNRTHKEPVFEDRFGRDSSDAQRWLDRTVHALLVRRAGREDLVWYHFSAHPVCYTDALAGPDWPGLVAARVSRRLKAQASFLQGHCGDVNPGSGKPPLGEPDKIADELSAAIERALAGSRRVRVDSLRTISRAVDLPLDLERFKGWLTEYQADPVGSIRRGWVDARFAADWARGAQRWDLNVRALATPISVLRLGDVAMAFHPAEMYTCYGLTIRRDSPAADTLVVGYTDDLIGYLPDPAAFEGREYAAIVVPKILDLPPFTPEAGRRLTATLLAMLREA